MEEIKRFKFTFISYPLLKAKKGNHKIYDMNT